MYWLYLLVYVAVGIVSPAVYMWIIRSFSRSRNRDRIRIEAVSRI